METDVLDKKPLTANYLREKSLGRVAEFMKPAGIPFGGPA